MLWVILTLPFIIILFYFTADNLPPRFQKRGRGSQKDNIINIDKRQELVQILKENIGNTITIQSKDFTCIYENRIIKDKQEITGKVLEVDDEWLNIEFDSRVFVKKDSLDQLIFRIDRINSFFINTESN